MKKELLLLLLMVNVITVGGQVTVATALCNNREDPSGVHTKQFFFSWELTSEKLNQVQTAYQVVMASSAKQLEAGTYDVYNSGKTYTSQSIQVYYKGASLAVATCYFWKVRIWDGSGAVSPWSKVQRFTTGLFDPADWKQAAWIGYEDMPEEKRVVPFVHMKMKADDPRIQKNPVAPLIRKDFSVSKTVQSALLFISGLGHYEASLDGEKLGNAFLAPGWTNYDKTVLYNMYDVTAQLDKGRHVLGILLGNGFYHVSQERYVKGSGYFGAPKMIALLKLRYTDGSAEYIVSDQSWETTPSPIVFNNIYGGEDYDATRVKKNWNRPSYTDSGWKKAVLTALPRGRLVPETDYPVTFMDSFSVVSSKIIGPNTVVYDFGQNVSGIPRIRIKGLPGQKVKLIPAELVSENGAVWQADGVAPHYYQYTIGSTDEETWHPSFSYFAVRYVQVEGIDVTGGKAEAPVLTELKLLHNRNSAPSNGNFTCSDSLINRIYRLIDWAIKSNIQSYITDNPQREKLSWQGEQNFMRRAINYNYNMYSMYQGLIRNVKDAQHANGLVPDIAPEYIQFGGPFVDSPEWGTTGILDLWFLYKFYGDTAAIRNNYEMMKAYAGYLSGKAQGHLLLYGLGDWLDIGNVTPIGVTASAYYFKAISALGEMAAIIGKPDEAVQYKQLALEIKKAFNKKYFDKARGIYATGSQTAMAMPLVLEMVEAPYRQRVLTSLVKLVQEADANRLTAGDVGHKFLVRALFENGYANVLYTMMKKEDSPGYAYLLKLGATALVETWDGKASQNQLAMGHILEWFHEGIAGIRQHPGSVAFKKIVIAPQMTDEVQHAAGSFHAPYGWIRSNWEKKGNTFTIKVEIPVNTTATVVLPGKKGSRLFVNERLSPAFKQEGDALTTELGSGIYTIAVE